MQRTEPSHKRVRIVFGGETIVDTTDALYVWEIPNYPQYYVPIADVRAGVLSPSGTATSTLGVTQQFSVQGGGRRVDDAAWSYPDAPELRDRVRFDFRAMDAWFEEDEQLMVHPRDPYTRIQILPSSRPVRVEREGVVLAESTRPTFLYESNLPRRTYLPRDDVRMALLTSSARMSQCPYKGTAEYWSVDVNGTTVPDLVWSYPDPLRESAPIAGLLAFYDERVDVFVDGEKVERPPRRLR